MALLTYALLIPFALAPALIWLAFYLRKDAHPEPNGMILKIFLAGMLATVPAIYLELFGQCLLAFFASPEIGFHPVACLQQPPPFLSPVFRIVYFFAGVALVEELVKYAVVRLGAISNPALDEPLDFMLYMVIAALGFAAFENILLLFKLIHIYPISDLFLVNSMRFIQAIFLHALVSALFGYFLALSFLYRKHRFLLFAGGLSLATLLHGAFNLYIFNVGGQSFFHLLLPLLPLLALATFISFAFRKLKTTIYATKTQPN